MKRKDPLKIFTNQTKANVSFLMMSSPNGTISSNVALNRRKLRKLLFTHYLNENLIKYGKNLPKRLNYFFREQF